MHAAISNAVFVAFIAVSLFYSMQWRNARNVAIHMPHVHGKVLDVGCHDGLFAATLLNRSSAMDSIVGIDPYLPKTTYIPAQHYDGVNIPFADKEFDVVLATFILHHAKDPARVIREMKRVGKRLVVMEDYVDTFWARWSTTLMHEEMALSWGLNMGYERFRSVAEWKEMFEQNGLVIVAEREYRSMCVLLPTIRHVAFVAVDKNDKEELQRDVQLHTPGIDIIDVVTFLFVVAICFILCRAVQKCLRWCVKK